MPASYEVAVIGAGPGGYVAAIRCAQLGLNTVCIDAWTNSAGKPVLGGTCLNVGCIPSKALLESSERYAHLRQGIGEHGIAVKDASMDVGRMLVRKDKIVDKSTAGIAYLFRKNKVDSKPGTGRFVRTGDNCVLEVVNGNEREEITARCVIVASGSIPASLPLFPVDGESVVDNAGALSFEAPPKRLGIIGAGVIGLELGSVWRRLGSEVTLFEPHHTFLASADTQVAAEAWRLFTKEQGLTVKLSAKPVSMQLGKSGIRVAYQDAQGAQRFECDKLLVAAGRVPNTAGINAEAAGLKLDARGFIEVDAHCRTTLPNVYAIGDCVRGPMLAHKASEEGLAVAERIAGQQPEVNYAAIPSVLYTAPEIAWVGQTEQALRAAGTAFRKGVFWFMANGRAQALGETHGFVKVLADDLTDRILGVHMIGPRVSELLGEAVVAMEFAAAAEDLARICHAHPTLSEALHEAALAALGRPLHQ
ncbi:MAG TPA: dihydrolipoyl dehydrogenase [Acidiferrobacterales bacterium]|nr:dihydrolipoyl dehydrogenase [Acidiferrobacterales bacterium]